jgi:hypothetical protein
MYELILYFPKKMNTSAHLKHLYVEFVQISRNSALVIVFQTNMAQNSLKDGLTQTRGYARIAMDESA